MVSANSTRQKQAGDRRWFRRVLLAAAIALLAALAWYWAPLNARALAGAAYGARVGCSCRFVAGRSLSDCRKDFMPGMQPVILSEDDAQKTVTAWVPLLASQTATFQEGPGCVLEPWED